MNLVKRTVRGIVWAQVGKVAEMVMALVLSVVVVRRLGPEAYGEYGVVLSMVAMGYLVTGLGFRQILGKHIPFLLAENELGGARALLHWVLRWRLALTGAVVIGFLLLVEVLASLFHLPNLRTYRWPVILLFVSKNVHLLLIDFFSATLKMKRVVVVNLVWWSASLALTLILFEVRGVSVAAVLYASGLAIVISLVVGLALSYPWLRRGDPTSPREHLWRFGTTVWLTDLANFGLGTETDTLLMGLLLTDKAQIGFYRVAVNPVQRLMGFLFTAWSGLTMPVLSGSYAMRGEGGVLRAWTSYVKLICLLALPMLIMLGALAEPILRLLYSDEFARSAGLLQLYIMFQVIGFAVGHGLNTQLLQTLNKEALALRLRLVAAGLNILLTLLLIPLWGVAGALVSTGISGGLMWFVETLLAVRQFKLKYPWAFLAKVLLASLVAALVVHLVPIPGLVGLMLGGTVYAVVFLGVLLVLRPLSENDKALLIRLDARMAFLARLP